MADQSYRSQVAEEMIRQIKAGTTPWQKPWTPGLLRSGPHNPTTGKPYRGMNAWWLEMQGRADPRWLTYRQAADQEAQVRKGERGTTVEYWLWSEEKPLLDASGKKVLGEDGKPRMVSTELDHPRVFYARVFNAEQIDGLAPLKVLEPTFEPVAEAEQILATSGVPIHHDQDDRGFYRTTTDAIHLPPKGAFLDAYKYYATALHELGHATGHPKRLNRTFGPFGSQDYAVEELRAEMASFIVATELGLGHYPERHAGYVESWLKAVANDPNVLFRAARDAEKIRNWVMEPDRRLALEKGADMDQQPGMEPDRNLAPEKGAVISVQRQYLDVPFSDKDDAKALGAKWDRAEKSWYVPEGTDATTFAEWTKRDIAQAAAPDPIKAEGKAEQSPDKAPRTYLAVPFTDREQAKALGAKWDRAEKSWYVPAGTDATAFAQWEKKDMAQAPSLASAEAQRLRVQNAEEYQEKVKAALKDVPHSLSSQYLSEATGAYLGAEIQSWADFPRVWSDAKIPEAHIDAILDRATIAGNWPTKAAEVMGLDGGQNDLNQLARDLPFLDWDSDFSDDRQARQRAHEKIKSTEKSFASLVAMSPKHAELASVLWDHEANVNSRAPDQRPGGYVPVEARRDPFVAKLAVDPFAATLEAHGLSQAVTPSMEQQPGKAPEPRIYLAVPFTDREQAKELGAKWDRAEKSWYVPAGTDAAAFAQWEKQAPPRSDQLLDAVSRYLRNEVDLRTRRLGNDTTLYLDNQELAVVHGPLTQDSALRALGEALSQSFKADHRTLPADVTKMSLDEFTAAYSFGRFLPEFEIPARDIGSVVYGGTDGQLQVNLRELHARIQTRDVVMTPHNASFAKQAHGLSQAVTPSMEQQPGKASEPRTYLAVPYEEKNQAKKLGAKWDRHRKSWFAPEGADLAPFERWRLKEVAPTQARDIDPTDEFAQALEKEGLVLKGAPLMDGKWHRVPVIGDKQGSLSGSYRGFLDGKPNGSIMNYKNGQEAVKWISTGTALDPQELERLKVEANARQAAREAERKALSAEAEKRAQSLWNDRDQAPVRQDHPYLVRKGITASPSIGSSRDNLLVPMHDTEGTLRNIQAIDPNGDKRFVKSGPKTGLMHVIGGGEDPTKGDIFIVAEGYATNKSLHDAVGLPVVIAFDAHNLQPVAEALRKKNPNATLIIAGDDDHRRDRNVGFENARDAAAAVGGFHISPRFTEAEKVQGLTDYNDLAGARGEKAFARDVLEQLDAALGVKSQGKNRAVAGMAM